MATPLIMRRPKVAKRKRFIGQEVFRTIVEMAYEMEYAEKATQDWDKSVQVLNHLLDRVISSHQVWMMKKPSCRNTILSDSPRRLGQIGKRAFEMVSVPYKHPVLVQPSSPITYEIRRFIVTVDKYRTTRPNNGIVRSHIIEWGDITLGNQSYNKEQNTWSWPNTRHMWSANEYTTNESFITVLMKTARAYERESYGL